MEEEPIQYRLRCSLRGHEDDVRGVCVCGDAGIATSSRDRTVRFWSIDGDRKKAYLLRKTLIGHSSFVGPLSWIAPGETFPDGAIVSGGMDTLVLLWDLRTGKVAESMRGHQLQVTDVATDVNGDIISSSVDCTIKKWRNGELIDSWEAHKVAIQAIALLPSGELISGSSDATLKLWKGKACVRTFSGHTDTVRDLSIMPGIGVLSASHDASIRLWALTGELLLEMVGHTSLVYSVDTHSSGLIASGSEDCSLKLWRDGTCIQSIDHPGCVWDVKFLENGDIVTACSDGIARVWTLHHDQLAELDNLEAYALELSDYKTGRKKVGGVKLTDLPGLELLQIPGTNNGETKIVREGDNGVAYSWNSREYKWDKIGEVVDGPGDNKQNQFLDGVQYDFVFDVDIGDGEPIRKLPYNRGDNPYETADKWLLKENLPLVYRQQVVEFILQNSGQQNFVLDSSFRDPYTGSSAYVPGQPSLAQSNVPAKPDFKHIPKKGMLLFEVAQYDGIFKKILEFNARLLHNREGPLSLSEKEMSRVASIVEVLKDEAHYHCTKFVDFDLSLLWKIVTKWPNAMVFPAIDVLRMLVLHPEGATSILRHIEAGNDLLMLTFKRATTDPTQSGNLLTIMRTAVNLFKDSRFSQWLQLNCSEILDTLSDCRQSFNKNINLAYATLLLKLLSCL